MDHQIIIRRIDASHAKELSALAKDIYKEHYLHLWNEGGADWYMHAYAYPEDILRKELEDENILYSIAFKNNKAIGYLKIKINEPLQRFEQLNALELERIYIHKKATGKGLGKQMMQYVFDIAQQYQKDTVFLKAMDSSADAIVFYKNLGFEICGTFQLPMPTFEWMKKEFRGMVVLKKDMFL